VARRISVEIVGDASSLERAFAKSSKSARQFDRSMDKTSRNTRRSFGGLHRTIGASIAGVGFAALVKESVTAASDLEQQVSKTNVVFGESAQAVEAWAKTLASSFGLSEREALTLASTFGALFAPLGIVGKEAADQSQKLVELGADLASFYNTDVQDALAAIQSGLVGQARPLRRYGVLLDAARVQQEALTETGKKSASQLTNQEKVVARIALLFKDSRKAQGDFARTSDQAAQQTKIFEANLENLKEELGKGVVPALAGATSALNDFFAALKPERGRQKWWQKSGLQALQDLSENLPGGGFAKRHRLPFTRPNEGPDVFAGLFGPASSVGAAFQAALDRANALDKKRSQQTKKQLQERQARIRQANEAARQAVLDRAEFNVEKTGATKTLKDDLAALRHYNSLLTKRIRGGHGTLDLEREQFRVQQQIADVLKRQADLAKKTRKKLGVDVTRFQKSARGQFVIAGGGGRGITIAGGVHLHGIQNVGQLENELARRSKQRAHQRRRR
jgi:hypothetical protein